MIPQGDIDRRKFEIHVSDLSAYKECRRRWGWVSPLRMNLRPEHTKIYFIVGRAVHYSIGEWYENGTLPHITYDLYMRELRKFESIAPGDDEEQVRIGRGVCENYHSWVTSVEEPDEDWKILATEMKFKTPLYNLKGKKSNRIFLAGRIDGVWEHRRTGDIWLVEFKTTAREPNPKWPQLDDQAAGYCWAAEQIFGRRVKGMMFRFLKKRMPEPPKRIRNGKALSRAINSSLHTTEKLYLQAIRELAADSLEPNATDLEIGHAAATLEGDYADILDQLAMQGYEHYFAEFMTPRSPAEIKTMGRELWQVGLEMSRDSTFIYSEPDWQRCVRCAFREPCLLTNEGRDEAVRLTFKHKFLQRDKRLEPEYVLDQHKENLQ